MSNKDYDNPPLAIRSPEGLIDLLFDEIDWIRSHKGNTTRANVIARMSETILSSYRFLNPHSDEIQNGTDDL